MNAVAKRLTIWLGFGALLAAGLIWLLWPRAIQVDLAVVSPDRLVVTVDEQGETRVANTFAVSAPVAGHMKRIEVEAGDTVKAGTTVVAEIEPIDPSLLDVRTQAQARAAATAAESAQRLARSRLDQAQAELDFSTAELKRAQQLREQLIIPVRELEAAVRNERMAVAALATARAALAVSDAELEQAKAQLLGPTDVESLESDCVCVPVLASVSGQVLRVLRRSEGIVAAGETLLELGDTSDLEVVVDLLSTDAILVNAGQRALITEWGGSKVLTGSVRRVDPYAQTRVSALGIEEKRVDVTIALESPIEDRTRLGHGFQVEASIILWESDDALSVPLTALFRVGDQWAMYKERDGKAYREFVSLGKRTGTHAQIIEGVEAGERFVQYPNDRIRDQVKIAQREIL